MTKCQPAREISDLFLPKKGLRMNKIKVPELFWTVHLHKTTKEKLQVTQLLLPLAACLKIANLRIESNLLLLSREVVYSVHYWRKCLLTREVEMHEYTCAVVSVLILCFFLVLRIFWEEQLAEQFWYFNFSLYLVVFWAEQSEKAPCTSVFKWPPYCSILKRN